MFAVVISLGLSACGTEIDREEADQKLEKACKTGLKAVSNAERLEDVSEVRFADVTENGVELREVTFSAELVTGGDYKWAETVRCLFEEESGRFGYTGEIIRIEYRDEIVGDVEGEIKGGLKAHMALTEAVGNILR